MIAVDTNIIVRFLTKDDEQHCQKAYRIFTGRETIFIPTTVILETEWVLRFTYRYPADSINHALFGLIGLEIVTIENENKVISALQWHQQGLDFADALHLAGSLQADQFVSFDKKLIKKAAGLNVSVVLLEP